jgi:hypothetical protein
MNYERQYAIAMLCLTVWSCILSVEYMIFETIFVLGATGVILFIVWVGLLIKMALGKEDIKGKIR